VRLDELYDAALEVPLSATREQFTADEVARLSAMLSVAKTVGEHPRRLEDGSDDDLKIDKMRSKRVSHALEQVLSGWNGSKPDVKADENIRQRAARMEWTDWWKEHDQWLGQRMVFLATWAKKTGQSTRWSKQALMRLENERRWLANALRE
jgi:hypothetical protein